MVFARESLLKTLDHVDFIEVQLYFMMKVVEVVNFIAHGGVLGYYSSQN